MKPEAAAVRGWTIEFDAIGLAPDEVRMVSAVIEGNLSMLRLAFPAAGAGADEDVERRNAEHVWRMVSVEFPHITFRLTAIRGTNGKASCR